jgi:hypothetical protein
MRKFSKLNKGYQILGLDSNELVNDLKNIGDKVTFELKFLKLNYDGSIFGGGGWVEYDISDFKLKSEEDKDEYFFVPHFYFNFRLVNKYGIINNFINNSSDNIEFSGAYSLLPFLEQLSKLKEILQKYEGDFHVLLYMGDDDDDGSGGSVLNLSNTLLKIELLGKDPLEIKELIKMIKK